MSAKTKKPAPKSDAVKIICICDRLPLPDGTVLVRDMTATVPTADAVAYESAERAERV